MVIGASVVSAPLVSTKVFASDVLTGLLVAEVVSVIDEVIVVTSAITINNLIEAITPTVTTKHPSKHNIY